MIIRETFWRIVQRRSTEEYECFPYICTLMSSSLWTYYGIVTPGEYLVSTVNGFGALAESIYVLIFLFFVPKSRFLKTVVVVLALNVCFPVIAIAGTRTLFGDANSRSSSMGFICATLNIIMYGSPLSAIVSLSFFSLSHYLNILYTLATKDNNIYAIPITLLCLLSKGLWLVVVEN